MLVIAGGKGDPDLNWLAHAADHRGLPHLLCHCNSRCASVMEWDLDADTLTIDGCTISPDGAALYIRYSMFDSYGEDSPEDCHILVENWYQTIKGWAFAHPQVAMFNRRADVLEINKPYNLLRARKCGFAVPETKILNNVQQFPEDPQDWAAKVVGDGEPTRLLADMLQQEHKPKVFNARPWIIQRKLTYPEVRLFRVGKWLFAFEIHSTALDCRPDENLALEGIDVPDELIAPMHKLTDGLGLDFAAADFKTCPETGRLLFLEINTAPTFSGYDAKVQGRLSDAMILHLQTLSAAK